MNQEYLGSVVRVIIDRPLGTTHPQFDSLYPINYGYIPNTISGDGEELDAYILGEDEPMRSFEGEVIAIIHRLNDDDDRLVVVEKGKNYTDKEIRDATYFQEKWFKSIIIRN